MEQVNKFEPWTLSFYGLFMSFWCSRSAFSLSYYRNDYPAFAATVFDRFIQDFLGSSEQKFVISCFIALYDIKRISVQMVHDTQYLSR
jgi:hypothetical protein